MGTEVSRREWMKNALGAGAAFAAGGTLLATAQEGRADEAMGGGVPQKKMFNLLEYGAVGDGTADDTAAFQSAVDACLKAGGGLVAIPSGKYRITRPITISSAERIDIVGSGTTSELLHEEDAPLLIWPDGVACRESTVRDLCFSSVGKDKAPATPMILSSSSVERSLFSNLLMRSGGAKMGSGIVTEGVADSTTIEHCLLWGPVTGTGIKIARGSEVRVFGARVIGSHNIYNEAPKGNIGIHVAGGNGGVHVVTTDIIALETSMKIGEPGAISNREIFITHATFDSSFHGLWQVDNAYTSVAGIWSASADEDQVLLDSSATHAILVITGGTIFNGGVYGRPGAHNGMVVRAGTFLLNAVSVRHNKGHGILIENPEVQGYTISGCRIHDNGTGAVLDGRDYAVTGNVFMNNGVHLEDRGGGMKQLTGNVIPPA